MEKYRILAIDGGGVRGILPAKLLERLTHTFPDLLEKTDLLVGTSAGSFVALGLASGKSPKEVVQWFETKCKDVFAHPRWFHFMKPKYSNHRLKKTLEEGFGDKRLNDLQKKVVVPSFSVVGKEHWGPTFFNNFPGSKTINTKLKDVALSSSAAPTYFPSYKHNIDGGVFANNPSTVGLAFAASLVGEGQPLDNISLLSIGTGFYPYQMKQPTKGWGELEWLGVPFFYRPSNKNEPDTPLLDVVFDGVSLVDATLSEMFLKERYFRLNPTLTNPTQLDDISQIPSLLKLGDEADLSLAQTYIRELYLK